MTIVLVVISAMVFVGSVAWFLTTSSDVVEISMVLSILFSCIFLVAFIGVGASEGWTEEGRKEHITELRTELIEKIQKTKDPYMLGTLADEVYEFNETYEDDAIDFGMYVRDKY